MIRDCPDPNPKHVQDRLGTTQERHTRKIARKESVLEIRMSLDSSLKTKGALAGKRSVLTRAERITKLLEEKKIDPKKSGALGLAKTLVK